MTAQAPPDPRLLTRDELNEAVRAFLESRPLYSPTEISCAEAVQPDDDIFPSAITMICLACKKNALSKADHPTGSKTLPQFGEGQCVRYNCVFCEEGHVDFWIVRRYEKSTTGGTLTNRGPMAWVETDRKHFLLKKIGQNPPWSIAVDRDVQAAIDADDVVLYKRALGSMSQGSGIGAIAYFRRLVENEMHRVLDLLKEAAAIEGDAGLVTRIDDARAERRADEQLRIAIELVPPPLRLGMNPIKVLYDQYSAGLHARSDEECIDVAIKLHAAFEYIFKTFRTLVRQQRELRRTLQEKI